MYRRPLINCAACLADLEILTVHLYPTNTLSHGTAPPPPPLPEKKKWYILAPNKCSNQKNKSCQKTTQLAGKGWPDKKTIFKY